MALPPPPKPLRSLGNCTSAWAVPGNTRPPTAAAAPAPAPATAPMKPRRLRDARGWESSLIGGLRLIWKLRRERENPRMIRSLTGQIITNCHLIRWGQVDSHGIPREHPGRFRPNTAAEG